MSPLIIILGPTASGKSSLAIKLAKKFNGEIISADSRQVYKGMDIGTGKVTKAEQKIVPHHLLDVADPKKQFTVADYTLVSKKTIGKIGTRGKIPFVVGGTAFYIYSLLGDWNIPEVKPNKKLRSILRSKSTPQLFAMLSKLDPVRAKNIDKNNPVRLIRAIEIVKTTNSPVPVILSTANDPTHKSDSSASPRNDKILILGVKKDQNELYKLIDKRVADRFKQGLVGETKKLLKSGVSIKRLEQIGLTYRIVANGIKNKLPQSEMIKLVQAAERKFSKRQMTWFKRDKRIHWVTNQKQAEKLIKNYILTPPIPSYSKRGRTKF